MPRSQDDAGGKSETWAKLSGGKIAASPVIMIQWRTGNFHRPTSPPQYPTLDHRGTSTQKRRHRHMPPYSSINRIASSRPWRGQMTWIRRLLQTPKQMGSSRVRAGMQSDVKPRAVLGDTNRGERESEWLSAQPKRKYPDCAFAVICENDHRMVSVGVQMC